MNEISTSPQTTGEPMTASEPAEGDLTPGRISRTAIVLAGLVAGTIDIGIACAINHVNPVVVLLVIASGLMGKAAFHAGIWPAALGLLLQWAMSIIISGIFVMVARRFARRYWTVAGLIYGAVVFLVMNFVVQPLSAVPIPVHFTAKTFAENLAAMLLFGVIVSTLTRPSTRRAAESQSRRYFPT